MPTPLEQIRQDYREAVACAIEGIDNLEAWNRVRIALSNAILSAWLQAAAKTADGIPVCEITKILYAKDCGAGKEGSAGFQPGNTCAGDGDGGGSPTSTPEFKSWFGDSKVVDDDSGEPLVVYHGTNQDFDEFNIDRSKTERNKHFQGDGMFFSENEYTAEQYSNSQINQFYDKDLVIDELIKSGKPNTAEFIKWQTELGFAKAWELAEEKHGTWSNIDIALEKEGVTDSNDISDIAEWIAGSEEEKSSAFGEFLYLPDSIKEIAKRLGISKYTPKPQTLAVYLKAENILETDNQEEAKNARANGYDAVKYTGPDRVGDSPEWIIFDPTQIKSATGNTGDFDPDNPKITHAKSDCGAGKEGSAGFQPGNTCAGDGDGGGGERKKVVIPKDTLEKPSAGYLSVGHHGDWEDYKQVSLFFLADGEMHTTTIEELAEELGQWKVDDLEGFVTHAHWEVFMRNAGKSDLFVGRIDPVTERYSFTASPKAIKENRENGDANLDAMRKYMDEHHPNFVEHIEEEVNDILESESGDGGGKSILDKSKKEIESAFGAEEVHRDSGNEMWLKDEIKNVEYTDIGWGGEGKRLLDQLKKINPKGDEEEIRKGALWRMRGRTQGSTTLAIRGLWVNPKILQEVTGSNLEQRDLDEPRTQELVKSMKEKGWDEDSYIHVVVHHDGDVRISEGNHRKVASKEAGLDKVKLEITYKLGGENLDPEEYRNDVFHPDKLVDYVYDPDNPKITHAKSDCGAGKEGSKGFQPGNTCAGEGGGERERVTDSDLSEVESRIMEDIEDSLIPEDIVKELYGSYDEAVDSILTNAEEAVYDDEMKDLINWKDDGEKLIQKTKDYFYTKTQDWLKEKYGDVETLTVYRGDYSNRVGKYTEPEFVSTDPTAAEFFATTTAGKDSPSGERGVTQYEIPMESILMCQECFSKGSFGENALLVSPDALIKSIAGDGGGSPTGNTGDFDPDNPKITHKRTFAKVDAFDELFKQFDIEPTLEVGPNLEALADLEGRVPMVRQAVEQMEALSKTLAEEVVVAERMGVLPFMESTSKGVQAALKNAFWVSDVDHSVVINIQRLLADAIRGVMPERTLSLPEFIDHAKLEGAANLTDSRLETIFRTNVSTAANEGVMSVLRDPEAKDLFPLVMITEIDDDRSRPHHAAMDGYITTPAEMDRLKLRPPNGYNCRGSLIKIAWDEADDMGLLDDMGQPDMIAIRRKNSPVQEGLIASGVYPDEGFKRGGFVM